MESLAPPPAPLTALYHEREASKPNGEQARAAGWTPSIRATLAPYGALVPARTGGTTRPDTGKWLAMHKSALRIAALKGACLCVC